MRRQFRRPRKTQSIFWLVVICLALWNLGLQPQYVSAYQIEPPTSTPTLPSETPSPQETQPVFTNTVESTFMITPAETATSLPLSTATVTLLPENSAVPTSLNVPVLSGNYASDEVLIRVRNNAAYENILQCLSLSNATVLSVIEDLHVWVVQVPFGRVAESIAALSACPEVRYAEPNYKAFIADTIPSDANWGLQYGLINIHAPQGWDMATGSAAVTIAIVDSGVDLGHADLAAKIVPGYDFVNNDSIPQDDNGHGTHVAGIAAASSNNGVGVAGVSWGARIMPVKVLDSNGNGSFANVAAGISWATDNGAQVINLSVGGGSPSTVLQDAVNYAYGKGVVLVAAAGNTGSGFVLYPARYPNVIAVGAVDNANNRAGFSNFGPELDLVAPGSLIYSTVIGGYGYKSGTSMAAPYVSGLAAILRGYPGGYSPAGIAFAMESSALDLGIPGVDNLYGYGLIQMDRAIQLVYTPPTSTPTLTFTPTLTPAPTKTFILPVPGNQSSSPFTGSDSTLIPIPTTSQIPTTIVARTETATQTLLPPDITQGQETETSEMYALSTPQAGNKELPLSTLTLPCMGIVFILLGIWLFVIARQMQGDQQKRKRII